MKVQCSSDNDNDNDKNLKIFRADLLDYHSIIDTLSGCSALFYTFEPPPEHQVYDVSALLSLLMHAVDSNIYLISGNLTGMVNCRNKWPKLK